MPISLPYTEIDGTTASGAQMTANLNVLLQAANKALNIDGSSVVTANIGMGGFTFTGLADAVALGSPVTMNQFPGKTGITISLTDYGVNVAAVNAALARLTTAGGGTLLIPPGSYTWASSDLSTPILLPTNTTIQGVGFPLITITGSSIIGSVFRASDVSNVRIRDLQCYGNSQAVADASSGAFLNYVQTTAGTGIGNLIVENVRLTNFAAERWISVLNNHATLPIIGVRLNNISAYSLTGNNLGGASIGIGANAIMVFGVTAPIKDVEVNNLYCDATYIKCGVTIFHQVQNVVINKPTIINAGLTGTNNDVGAYAINIYGNVGELTDVTVNSPVITAPRSCGIYFRGTYRVTVNKPMISGQTDVNSGTLPKGAISSDGSSYVSINGGFLSGNAFDIMAAADTSATTFNLDINGVTTLGSSQYSVVLNPTTGTGSPTGFTMRGCTIDGAANGVFLSNNIAAGGRNFANVLFDGNRITARLGSGITFNPNGSAVCANYRVFNTHILATNRGIDADNATGDLHIDNVIIEDYGSTLLVYGLIARTFPQLHIGNLLVRGMGTGYATLTDGAGGTITNLRTYNVINGCSPSSLGMIAPTLGGTQGWFVQNLNPVEAGVAASKYVNVGWRFATTWLQQRALTGN